jgi:hypothetical protein
MKSNKEIILKELWVWQEAYPKCKRVLNKFANKIILELKLQGGGDK